jgi:hypothetical protein
MGLFLLEHKELSEKIYSLNALGSFFNDSRAKFGHGSFPFKLNALGLFFFRSLSNFAQRYK